MAKTNVGEAHYGLTGKWKNILTTIGIDPNLLNGRHQTCPMCGGSDRFRFDDKGVGRYYCNQCGPGDGFKLIMHHKGITFREAINEAREIAGVVGTDPPKMEMDDASKRKRLNSVWRVGKTTADGLFEYLESRGIDRDLAIDPMLRWHPMLEWTQFNENNEKRRGSNPAMLVRYMHWENGKVAPVTIHRVWPSGPPKRKMVMPSPIDFDGIFSPLGGMPKNGRMGVVEGAETALSCMTIDRLIDREPQPWWSTYSAEELKKFQPPAGLQQLDIGLDIDYSFTGQAAGYELARRLRRDRPEIELRIIRPTPEDGVDFDFNDLLKRMRGLT